LKELFSGNDVIVLDRAIGKGVSRKKEKEFALIQIN